MDASHFDDFARLLAERPSRRNMLRALAWGLGGGVAALRGGVAGAAPRCKRIGQHCQTSEDCCPGPTRNGNVYCDAAGTRQCQACPSGTVACNGGCADLLTDVDNCGACNTICPFGAICNAGVCCTPEPASTTCAGKDCGTAVNNCGQNVTCGPETCSGTGETCGGGGVPNVCGCTDDGTACAGKDCGDTVNNCGQTVNCGTCTGTGQTCGGGGIPGVCGCTDDGTACSDKECGYATNNCGATVFCGDCGTGLTCCNNHCVDLSSDNANCGDCGITCPASEFLTCQTGSCECQPGVPDFCPNIGCVDLQTDVSNCGSCGTECNTGAGEICCSGSCRNILNDPDNCGGCGKACFTGSDCVAGVCK
jgi:hypothetical protein